MRTKKSGRQPIYSAFLFTLVTLGNVKAECLNKNKQSVVILAREHGIEVKKFVSIITCSRFRLLLLSHLALPPPIYPSSVSLFFLTDQRLRNILISNLP